MPTATHTLSFPGAMTQRGFWLYVFKITSSEGKLLLYVGMTGDNASTNAASPFARMGQHLGENKNENAIRHHLEERGVSPEECVSFEMVAHGPLFPEVKDSYEHKMSWKKVVALEKALADALRNAGHCILNEVNSRQCLDPDLWRRVRGAFACHFDLPGPDS